MKLNKNLALAVGSLAITSSLSASEIAPLQIFLPNSYSSLDLSHSSSSKASDTSHVDAAYTLGSTFFDDSLDIYATIGFEKHNNTSHIAQKSTEIEVDYAALKMGPATFQPYLVWNTPFKDVNGKSKGSEGRAGFALPVEHVISTGAGSMLFGAEYDLTGTFNGEAQKIALTKDGKPVNDETATSLRLTADKDGKYTAPSEAFGLRQAVSAKVSFVPNFVSDLMIEFKTSHKAIGTPKMLVDNDGKVEMKRTDFGTPDYSHQGATKHRLRVKYDLNDTVYLQNDFTFANAKDETTGSRGYENLLSMNTTLF